MKGYVLLVKIPLMDWSLMSNAMMIETIPQDKLSILSSVRVMVVEDDPSILELVKHHLERENCLVTTSLSGNNGLSVIESEHFEIILLDVMLPDMNGIEICRRIRANPDLHSISIIMVTAKGDDNSILEGLEAGADAYVTKPFSPKVLMSKVKAVFRKYHPAKETSQDNKPIRCRNILIHPGRHEVYMDNQILTLTYSEFQALYFLAKHPGWVYTRSQIINAIRGEDYPVTDRSVDVLIVGLRKKLKENGNLICSVRGIGYRFIDLSNNNA
jgi:two-component system phosphate regulon response regulator PhoB